MADERPIALYGGSFDPPHLGHAAIVQQLLYPMSGIKSVIVIPSCRPPHKNPMAPYGHRVTMCEKVFCGGVPPRVAIFNEDTGKDFTFTADVVQMLPNWGTQKYTIVLGTDEVRSLASWKTPERIFEHASLLIVDRPGELPIEESIPGIASLALCVQDAIVDAGHISISAVFEMSSSDIRRKLAVCYDAARPMLHYGVWKYIREHGLYGVEREEQEP